MRGTALARKQKTIGLMMALALTALLAACSKPEPIRIGFVAGTSGRVADLGIAGRNAAILAVANKNAAGGINGRPIELLIRNDEQNPETAKKVVQELIDAKVEAIIGHMTSSMSAATLPLANQAKMLMISPTSTAKELSGKDDYFFRVIAGTEAYSTRSAKFHRQILKTSRMAVVYDLRNRAYCESWFSDYRTTFEAAGGQISQVATFESGTNVHISALVQQLLDSRPDGILIIGNAVDAAFIAQQVRQKNSKIILTASEWAGTEHLIEIGGQAIEGLYLAQFIDRASQAPAYLKFLQDYRNRFSQEPGFAGTTTFDATMVILGALEKKKPDQSVKESILALRDYEGLQDKFSFDANGDTVRKNYLTVIRNGQFIKVDQ